MNQYNGRSVAEHKALFQISLAQFIADNPTKQLRPSLFDGNFVRFFHETVAFVHKHKKFPPDLETKWNALTVKHGFSKCSDISGLYKLLRKAEWNGRRACINGRVLVGGLEYIDAGVIAVRGIEGRKTKPKAIKAMAQKFYMSPEVASLVCGVLMQHPSEQHRSGILGDHNVRSNLGGVQSSTARKTVTHAARNNVPTDPRNKFPTATRKKGPTDARKKVPPAAAHNFSSFFEPEDDNDEEKLAKERTTHQQFMSGLATNLVNTSLSLVNDGMNQFQQNQHRHRENLQQARLNASLSLLVHGSEEEDEDDDNNFDFENDILGFQDHSLNDDPEFAPEGASPISSKESVSPASGSEKTAGSNTTNNNPTTQPGTTGVDGSEAFSEDVLGQQKGKTAADEQPFNLDSFNVFSDDFLDDLYHEELLSPSSKSNVDPVPPNTGKTVHTIAKLKATDHGPGRAPSESDSGLEEESTKEASTAKDESNESTESIAKDESVEEESTEDESVEANPPSSRTRPSVADAPRTVRRSRRLLEKKA